MQITFINGLLIFIIVNLILLYTYQILNGKCENNNNGICKYFSNKTINNTKQHNNLHTISKNNDNKTLIIDSSNNSLYHKNNKLRLLTNDKGPKVGFHQTFKQHLPELGWRDFYLRLNGGISNVKPLNPLTTIDGETIASETNIPFNNIITKNYLSQLESTDNIYSHVDY